MVETKQRLNKDWTPEQRRLQSKVISRRIRERPWTQEQNEARSKALKGRPKRIESRAAMYASRLHGRERTPEWNEAYERKLAELRRELYWRNIAQIAEEQGLTPDEVKFAMDFAYSDDGDAG